MCGGWGGGVGGPTNYFITIGSFLPTEWTVLGHTSMFMLLLGASRPRIVGLSEGLLVCLQNEIFYEPALSSKQELVSMRGVDVSPQHKGSTTTNIYIYKNK